MKIKPERSIENNMYTTVIKPTEFGTSDISSTEELEILKDTPQILKYSDIKFEDKFAVKDGLPEISTDPDAVTVTLKPINKEFAIDEDFEISFSVDAKNIPDSEVDGTVFTNKYTLAMAKVILFETKVINQIKKLLEEARSHVTSFEETTEQTL
mgnify:FL=1